MSDAGTITYATQQRVIAAGVESAFDVTAAYVACISASHTDFDARFNDGPVATFAPGLHVGGGGVPKTQKVSIRNTHPTDSLTIEIAYGIGQFFDRRLALPDDAVKVQPTAANPNFNVRPAVGQSFASHMQDIVAGGDASATLGLAADANRVKAHVTNHGTHAVRIVAAGTYGPVIVPDQTLTIDGGGALTVHNPSGVNPCRVSTLIEGWT